MRLPFSTVPSFLLAVATGLLFAVAFPPLDRGAIAFVALTPLMLAVRGQPRPRAAALAWVAGTIGCTSLVAPSIFVATRAYFGGDAGATALLLAGLLPQLHGALPIALFGIAAREAWARAPRPVGLLLALPTAWVATEMIRARLGYGMPWVLLAHAQHDHLWLLQVADLGGAAVVSWVVALANAGLALVLVVARRDRAVVVAVVTVVFAGVAAYGAHQLAVFAMPSEPMLDVAVVQPAVPDAWRTSLADVPAVLRRLHELTREAAAGHPDLIVWPENAVSVSIEDNPQVVAGIADVLDDTTRILLGGSRVRPGASAAMKNAAFLVDRAGRVRGVYEKQRLTPYGEYVPWMLRPFTRARDLYAPGDGPVLLALGEDHIGVTICAEALDAVLVRRMVEAGAEILVNLAHDGWWGGTAARTQHLDAVVLRAVENRRALVRATSDGVSAIVDARGAVVVGVAPVGQPAVLTANVAIMRTASLYGRYGDVFGWTCVGLTLVGCASPHRRRRRPRAPRSRSRS